MLGAIIGRFLGVAILSFLIVGGIYKADIIETVNWWYFALCAIGVHLALPETKL